MYDFVEMGKREREREREREIHYQKLTFNIQNHQMALEIQQHAQRFRQRQGSRTGIIVGAGAAGAASIEESDGTSNNDDGCVKI